MFEHNKDEMQDILRVNRLEAEAHKNDPANVTAEAEIGIDELQEMNMDLEMYRDIQAVLNVMVRPKLAEDGGDLELSYLDDDGVLWVQMTGGCAGCPSADETVKNLVQNEIVGRIPRIKSVEIDDGLDYDFIQNALDTMLSKRTKRD